MVKFVCGFILIVFFAVNCCAVAANDAVVRVFINGHINGCGFIVSPDGIIITANHVITTEKSDFTELAKTIEVERLGDKKSHAATVLSHSAETDTAILRIIADNLPHFDFGDSASVQPLDTVTTPTFFPESAFPITLTGTVAGKGMVSTGPIKANAIIFQMPVRRGFSGSPVLDAKGHVIGIVSTRMMGISPALETARKQLQSFPGKEGVIITGADFHETTLGLINSLDNDLVSGLGSAVDIAYAKQMLAEAKNKK